MNGTERALTDPMCAAISSGSFTAEVLPLDPSLMQNSFSFSI